MPRFDRLELGSQGAEPQNSAPKTSERKDHRHWLKQADAARRLGLYESALRLYSRALEEDKAAVIGWAGQVQMLVLLNELPEADLWARKALEIFPGNGELLATRAQALARLKDNRQAFALSDAALQSAGDSAYRWQVRGELMVAGRQTGDVPCFDKAEERHPDWLVPLETALIYLYHRRPSQAHARARRAVERAPSEAYSWYVQGQAELGLDFSAQARKSFERSLELNPNYADAKQRLSELNHRSPSPLRFLRRLFRVRR